jgi:hypothetical protein
MLPDFRKKKCVLEGSQASPICPAVKSNVWMKRGHRWNDIEGGKPKYSEQNLSHCHFVHQKSDTDRPGIEPGPLW